MVGGMWRWRSMFHGKGTIVMDLFSSEDQIICPLSKLVILSTHKSFAPWHRSSIDISPLCKDERPMFEFQSPIIPHLLKKIRREKILHKYIIIRFRNIKSPNIYH